MSAERVATASVLAVDGGNSKTDVALIAADGSILSAARGGPSNHQVIGIDNASAELRRLVREAAERAGLPADKPVAAHTLACLAGADLPVEEADLTRLVQSFGWSATSTVVNDTFAVLRAGLADDGPRWGIAVVCGAGMNCVGVAPDGRQFRFLALGELSGDWGGGGELGPQALWWAMRAEDGRGPQTALRSAVPAFFGLNRVEDVVVAMHLGTISYSERHRLVPVLFEVASRGDQVAADLLVKQATEVCLMAEAAARNVGLTGASAQRPAVAGGPAQRPGPAGGPAQRPGPAVVADRKAAPVDDTARNSDQAGPGPDGPAHGPVPVILGGSLMTARHPLMTSAIETRLADSLPGAQVRIVDIPPVAGAALLGLDHVGAPAAAAARLRADAAITW